MQGALILTVNFRSGFNSLEPPASTNNLVGMQFYQLAKGARFQFQGRQFTKVAMSMAEDADGNGNAFWSGTEVTPISLSTRQDCSGPRLALTRCRKSSTIARSRYSPLDAPARAPVGPLPRIAEHFSKPSLRAMLRSRSVNASGSFTGGERSPQVLSAARVS
jgi:hypothetical protein